MRENSLKTLWAQGKAATNCWIASDSAYVAEAMASQGWDTLTIDMQHGLIGVTEMHAMLTAVSGYPVTPLVRVPWNEPGVIMKALDAGAYGVICPTIETAEQARAFVSACEYPPKGERSWGPTRGVLYGGPDYFDNYRSEILTIALIETAKGVQNLDAIAAVPGLDVIYLGPNDLGVSHGAKPSYTPNHPEVDRAMDLVVAAAKKHGIAAGMHTASKEVAMAAKAKGYTLLSLGYASKIMMAAATTVLKDAFPQ